MKYKDFPSPCFILEESLLHQNLKSLASVQKKANISIILALKAFSMWSVFPIVARYLKGATGSSLHEARLIYEEMGVKSHTYAPAYIPNEFDELISYSSHITFNSLNQYHFYKEKCHRNGISCGLRVNPEYSEVETDLYNPCAEGSRLGVTQAALKEGLPKGIKGLHFHALCESDSYQLEKTLHAFEARFGPYLAQLDWVNFGGGHLITRKDYDKAHLIKLLQAFQKKYPNLHIILEPGSAIAWQTGVLKSTILDIVDRHGIKTAILDASFTAHMPDTLEMPYQPEIANASKSGAYKYRVGGMSCLAGDYIAEYNFEKPLAIGECLIFEDMIHYTMVKTTMFNGVKHPAIALLQKNNKAHILRTFGYEDFKNRLS